MPDDDLELRVKANPEKRFFISMLIRDIELVPAIADLVDNSVDSAHAVRPDGQLDGLAIDIVVSPDQFSIKDNCGGIDPGLAREYAFRFGRPQDFPGFSRSVGQFGVGMKRAIFKMGKRFRVESSTPVSHFVIDQDVEAWAAESLWDFHFAELDSQPQPAGNVHGTIIQVLDLHPSVSAEFALDTMIARLRADLQVRHLRAIGAGIRITLNGDELAATRPRLLNSAAFHPVRKSYREAVNGSGVDVDLMAGIIRSPESEADEGNAEDFASVADAGWYLFCNDRLVFAAERSRLTGWGEAAAAYHPQYRNFRGYAFLSAEDPSLLPWNTTKTGVDEDAVIFRSVQGQMGNALKRIQTVLNRLKKERQELDTQDRPLEQAIGEAIETPLFDLPMSDAGLVPPPVPSEVSSRLRIQYSVDREDFDRVAEVVGASVPRDVGQATFEHYLRTQVQ